MLKGRSVDAAVSLVHAHASREARGELADPADAAAVVAVERLAEWAGTTDATLLRSLLRQALQDWPAEGLEADPEGPEVLVRDLLEPVANALLRRETGTVPDASVLNAEGGAHPVATDATILRAATRASSRSFARVPYYRARYGGRGSRFATSDSGWLATLAGHRPETAQRHVEWLGALLAVRGMPTWLMELHLSELVLQLREADCQVGGLPTVVAQLRRRRRQHVPDALLEQSEAWVVSALESPPVQGSGHLVAAAVADELVGVTGDDTAVLNWMTDPDRTTRADAAALLQVRARIRAGVLG